ncbi:MAG: DUF1925 domain-containing protein [Deltaproteobacteria bacterium]|nr:DUF1925 domain-containing protein [Deltaproteobacteria bacterium]
MTKFILGFHCHQPVGNFDFIFKEVHAKSYSPLIRTLASLNVKFCLHASGILLEWWEKNDPKLIKIISEGVEKGLIEIIGGGYYEPILASIPSKDRLRQLEMLNKALKRLFGKYPSGAWITERIWQPDIIKDLREAGLKYAFLDDFQFFQAGISEDDIDNIFRTEYDGQYLDVFPIHERLRYKIPFAEPDESLNEILYLNGRCSNLSVMFDDGEKMGGWPDTYEWVYGKDGNKGWLENFVNEARHNDNYLEINFELPSNILSGSGVPPAKVPVYLPMSSYREMGEWTLSVGQRREYEEIRMQNPSAPLNGGIWHNFLTRYPEANLHHKKMLNLSYKINYSVKTYSKYLKEALNELLKSQANDAYWHGVFGGIYLPHLRRGIRAALLRSYRFYKDAVKEIIEKEYYDFDFDGENEILLSNDYWSIIYKPSAGSFAALDYIEKDLIHSLGDVFCLHNEYDILKLKENRLKKAAGGEMGGGSKDGGSGGGDSPPGTIHKEAKYPSDLCDEDLIIYKDALPAFEILFNDVKIYFNDEFIEENRSKGRIELQTAGFLKAAGEEAFVNLKIIVGRLLEFFIDSKTKTAGKLDVVYRFAFPGGDGPAVNPHRINPIKGLNNHIEKEIRTGADNFIFLKDSFWGGKICLKERTDKNFFRKYNMFFKPITTISLSESGYERIFQGVELKYSFNLKQEEDFSSIITIDIENIGKG